MSRPLPLVLLRLGTMLYLGGVWAVALVCGWVLLLGYLKVEGQSATVFQQQAAGIQVTALSALVLLVAVAFDRIGRAVGDGLEKVFA